MAIRFSLALAIFGLVANTAFCGAEGNDYRFLGTYSGIQYHEETGDLTGAEYRLVYATAGIHAVIVSTGGTAEKPIVIKAHENKGSIEFKYQTESTPLTSVRGYEKGGQQALSEFTASMAAFGLDHENVHRRGSYWNNYVSADAATSHPKGVHPFYWENPKPEDFTSSKTTICGTYSNLQQRAADEFEGTEIFVYPNYCVVQYAEPDFVSSGEVVPYLYHTAARRLEFIVAHSPIGTARFEGFLKASPAGNIIEGKFQNAEGRSLETTLTAGPSFWDRHRPRKTLESNR